MLEFIDAYDIEILLFPINKQCSVNWNVVEFLAVAIGLAFPYVEFRSTFYLTKVGSVLSGTAS